MSLLSILQPGHFERQDDGIANALIESTSVVAPGLAIGFAIAEYPDSLGYLTIAGGCYAAIRYAAAGIQAVQERRQSSRERTRLEYE